MAGKRLGGLVTVAALLASTGCCWWCDRWCPRQTSCQPVCCAPPAYAAPAYGAPAPATAYSGPPAPAPAAWSNPQAARPPLIYNPNTGCYCDQGR